MSRKEDALLDGVVRRIRQTNRNFAHIYDGVFSSGGRVVAYALYGGVRAVDVTVARYGSEERRNQQLLHINPDAVDVRLGPSGKGTTVVTKGAPSGELPLMDIALLPRGMFASLLEAGRRFQARPGGTYVVDTSLSEVFTQLEQKKTGERLLSVETGASTVLALSLPDWRMVDLVVFTNRGGTPEVTRRVQFDPHQVGVDRDAERNLVLYLTEGRQKVVDIPGGAPGVLNEVVNAGRQRFPKPSVA